MAADSAAPLQDDSPVVRWISAEDNPFGVELLDCHVFSQSMITVTEDPEVAETYGALRRSNGAEYSGRTPDNPATANCDLPYPHKGKVRDGPVFKAEVMEDKWDIYLHDGDLYFVRSWTGELEYRAKIAFREDELNVVAVTARREVFDEDPDYPIAAVDYLIRSHLYGLMVPHPLPKSMGRDPLQLAAFSFSRYGRYGLYGTFNFNRSFSWQKAFTKSSS